MTLLPLQSDRLDPVDSAAPSDAPARVSTVRSVVPVTVAVVGAFGLATTWASGALAPLLAAIQPGGAHVAADDASGGVPLADDLDGDGLENDYEWILHGDKTLADTDGDGFGDLEEFARGSSVFWSASTPLPGDLSTRMIARQGDGVVHVLLATYIADGNVDGYAMSMGLLAGGQPTLLPVDYVATYGSEHTVPLTGGAAVHLFEVPIRESLFHGLGFLSLYGTVADANMGTVIVADVVDVKSDTVSLFLRTQLKERPTTRADLRSQTQSGGSLYVPLPPPGQIPSTWNVGEICRQVSTVIGVSGGIVTREITSADCVEALESYCKSDCALSVGSVEQSVDPLTLIGG